MNTDEIGIPATDLNVIERSEIVADVWRNFFTGQPLRLGELCVRDAIATLSITEQMPFGMRQNVWLL